MDDPVCPRWAIVRVSIAKGALPSKHKFCMHLSACLIKQMRLCQERIAFGLALGNCSWERPLSTSCSCLHQLRKEFGRSTRTFLILLIDLSIFFFLLRDLYILPNPPMLCLNFGRR